MSRIKTLYRKYKQNQDKVRRTISITLVAILVVLVGALMVYIYNADKELARAKAGEVIQLESPIETNKKRDYGEAGFNQVAENDRLVLYADFTNGEMAIEDKLTGETWYTNPQDRAEDKIVPKKPSLAAQINVVALKIPNAALDRTTTGTLQYTTSDEPSSSGSVTLGGLDHKLIDGGIRFTYSFPKQGLKVPVEFTLTEDGFRAEIIAEEIEELWSERWLILNISLLPFFGAGGLEDEGYMVVPDGSGAIIEFNNGRQTFPAYSSYVYGEDLVEPKTTKSTWTEDIALPVFGLKNGDNAWLAIIEEGDTLASISAYPGRKQSSYNHAYATFTYHDWGQTGSNYNIAEASYTEPMMDGNYSVRYVFLSGDQADYAGMADYYRDYLVSEGNLTSSPLADKNYFTLNLYGAVRIEKYVFGIEKEVITPLTTYQDVMDIVKDLKESGVEHIIINYIGALQGGYEYKTMDYFAAEKKLGGSKKFKEMQEYLESEGVLLFVEHDPVNFYENGNGYNLERDSNLYFYETYSHQYEYTRNLNVAIKSGRWMLLKSSLVKDVVTDFAASAKKSGISNYSVNMIGSKLYSDYDELATCYRSDAVEIWKEILSFAQEEFEHVMVEGGNAYTLAYADVIRNVSFDFSDYSITDDGIPFYQLVTRGDKVLTSPSINLSADYRYLFLKCLETGCNLNYSWIAGDITQLVETDYDDMVSMGYDYWIDTAIAQYLEAKDVMDLTAGKRILGHTRLAKDIYETVYEGDIRVYVNYSDNAYTYNGITIAADGFAVSQ